MFRRYRTESLIALAAAIIAACWWPIRMRFPFDDTYITFRYAANLAHGLGIVWNQGGAHTEGYTNFLLVLLLAPFSAVGWDLVVVSQIIGVVAVMVTVVAIYRIVTRIADNATSVRDSAGGSQTKVASSTMIATFAVALFLLDPYIWMNAYSGLETSLFTMWLIVAVWAFVTKRMELAFMLATFAALTRPEGALMGMVLLAVALIQKRQHPKEEISATLKDHPPVSIFGYWVSAFVLPLAIYAGWKLYYFGNLLPNSFYVKVAQASSATMGGGTTFLPGRGTVRIFLESVWYLLPLALLAVWKLRKNAAVQIAALWCGLLSIFYLFSLLIQNEYQRFTNSIEVMLIMLVGLAVSLFIVPRMRANKEQRPHLYPFGGSGILTALFTILISCTFSIRGGSGYIQRTDEEKNPYPSVAKVLASIPNHEDITLAWGDAGRLPYFSGMRNLDPVGLNTNEIAHAHSAEEVIRFIIKSRPDLLIIPLILPRDDTIPNDTVRRVFEHGHGLIGAAYPALAAAALANGYQPIAAMPQSVYDLDILVDTTSIYCRDIVRTIAPYVGRDVNFQMPVMKMK
jgi:arabinofuranosyltransferase